MIDLRGVLKSELNRQWLILHDKLTKLLRWVFGADLPNIRELHFQVTEVNNLMRKAKVVLSWIQSPSDDVIRQSVKIVDPHDGQIFFDENLGPEVNEVVVPELLNEKQRLQAIVVVSDGINDSSPVVVDFTVPDLTAPAPVENLGFTYEVVDTDEE